MISCHAQAQFYFISRKFEKNDFFCCTFRIQIWLLLPQITDILNKFFSFKYRKFSKYSFLTRQQCGVVRVGFLASPSPCLFYISNCPTKWNTKQSIYYSASSLDMFLVSNTPIIRSTQNCNYSLRNCAATSLQRGQARLGHVGGRLLRKEYDQYRRL